MTINTNYNFFPNYYNKTEQNSQKLKGSNEHKTIYTSKTLMGFPETVEDNKMIFSPKKPMWLSITTYKNPFPQPITTHENPNSLPIETHANPFPQPITTHENPNSLPLETHANPFPQPITTHENPNSLPIETHANPFVI